MLKMAFLGEKDLIDKLKGTNINEIYDALQKIRQNYVRDREKLKFLLKCSVVKLIIPLIEHPKFCSISLSIIADGCLDLPFVNEVIKWDGVTSLMRIMKSFINDDIQNRACRAIGNMAKFDVGFQALNPMKLVTSIIDFLKDTNDENCQQTAIRTLMILGKSPKSRELIAQEKGMNYIAKLLHSSNDKVLICSTKALATLTTNISISSARQLQEFLRVLVELHSHSDMSVRNHALVSLKNLSYQEEIRTELVKVGAVKLFTETLSASESHEMSILAALSLCKCLDHIHMWSHNGLERAVGLKALLQVLLNKKFKNIHIYIISSLIPLSYEAKVADILLNLDVIHILIEILKYFIETHKCKFSKASYRMFFCEKGSLASDLKKDIHERGISKSYESIETEGGENSEYTLKNVTSTDKSPEHYSSKQTSKREYYRMSSVTSDYGGSCNSYKTFSPLQRQSVSPEIKYDIDRLSPVASPSTPGTSGVWSPVSLNDKDMPHYSNCWSPVISTHSNSELSENEDTDNTNDYEDNEKVHHLFSPPVKNKRILSPVINTDILEKTSKTFIGNQFPLSFETVNAKIEIDISDKNAKYPEMQNLRKKIKLTNSNEYKFTDLQSPTLENTNKTVISLNATASSMSDFNELSLTFSSPTKKTEKVRNTNVVDSSVLVHSDDVKTGVDIKYTSNKRIPCNLNLLSENIERQSIDYYVILFLFQISFHLEKKINSQLADKACFSVLIDYLCLVHNPSPKAETVLLNLMKNRYCFEKLILNGFVNELEEKMLSNSMCSHQFYVHKTYSNIISAGRKEVNSEYGIGTLGHVLLTSEKMGQFYAISTFAKLVTEKALLYKLLIQNNGLSLLLSFLSDTNITTQRKAALFVCEVYQSLIKEQKNEKCCFAETCSLKTTSKCCYKESFLNVTFSVSGGGKILANREKICESSEYFNALLEGYFLETNATMVNIPEISAENLSTIFHFLHGCGNGNCCPYIKRIPFSVSLELLCDCEKLLLKNIKTFMEDRLCHRLNSATVSKIYIQSKIHNSPALSKRALEFALSMNTSQKDDLWKCFEELIKLDSGFDFFNDIKNLIVSTF